MKIESEVVYICDGCGDEIPHKELHKVVMETPQGSEEWHMHKECYERAIRAFEKALTE